MTVTLNSISVSADYFKALNLRSKMKQNKIVPRRRNCQVLPSVPALKPRPLVKG